MMGWDFRKGNIGSKKMNFFGYPMEMWFASFVAVMFKLKMTSNWTIVGTITTVSIAMFSGLILYLPIVELLELSASWKVPVAILVSLTAENIMKSVVDLSADGDFLKDWIRYMVTKKFDKDGKNNDNNI